MALLDGGRGFALGFVTGVGAGYFSRELMDNPRARARPVAKFVMRTILQAGERAREAAARLGEFFQDTAAEVQADLKRESARRHRPVRRRARGGKVVHLPRRHREAA